MDEVDLRRRHVAKRFNERLKLSASFLSTTAVATLVGVIILPVAVGQATIVGVSPWLALVLVLYGLGQIVLSFLRSED